MKILTKRSLPLILFSVLMLAGGTYTIYSLLKKPKAIPAIVKPILTDRGSTEEEYQKYIKSIDEHAKQLTYRESTIDNNRDISIEKMITAEFLFLAGAMGMVKWWDKNSFTKIYDWMAGHDEKHESWNTNFKILIDQKNKDNIIEELKHIQESFLMVCTTPTIQVIVNSIFERTQRFTIATMNEDFTQDMYDCAMANMESRILESQRQIKEIQVSDNFRQAFLVVQASNLVQLKTGLLVIVSDNTHNDKYKRFGDVVKCFLKNYLREVINAYNKYESL